VELERPKGHAVELDPDRRAVGRAQERHPLTAGSAACAPNVQVTAPLPYELDRAC
jgi:hypothetical protein